MKLVIANTDIHQDAEGRFSLNDLHKASGAEERHQPALFIRLEQTQALIAEISNSTDSQNKNPIDSKSGRYGGSYGAKELVYAYAMWISPKFHLQVIRTFDEVVSEKAGAGRTTLPNPPKLFPDYFKVARLIGCDRNAAAISANQAVLQKTGENVLALLGQAGMEAEKQELVFNVSDLADGISGVKMNKMLEAAKLQTNDDGRWSPTDAGAKFCRIFDTGKRHGNGTPIQQIKWSKTVLAQLSIAETT